MSDKKLENVPKVTPEMIDAGLTVLRDSGAIEHPIEADRLVIERVYVVMQSIALSSGRTDHY